MLGEEYSYCSHPCKNAKCVRNKSNIVHPEILHEYEDLSNTDECLERSNNDTSD